MKSNISNSAIDLPLWIRTKTGVAFDDIPTIPGGRIPDFIIIGAAKAGTSALSNYLSQNSGVYMCKLKEPHYYSTDVMYERGQDWYRGLFAEATEDQICGEASTTYSLSNLSKITAQRVYRDNPSCRLVYLVREPVSRVISDVLQAMKYRKYVLGEADFPASIDEYLEEQPYIVESSVYIQQIETYTEIFDRAQLYVVTQKDLYSNLAQTLEGVARFIGAKPFSVIPERANVNVTGAFVAGEKDSKFFEIFDRIYGLRTLKSALPQGLKSNVKSIIRKSIPEKWVMPSLSKQKEAELRRYFKPFNRELGRYMSKDLTGW